LRGWISRAKSIERYGNQDTRSATSQTTATAQTAERAEASSAEGATLLNIDFPSYYKKPVGAWLAQEGFMLGNQNGQAERRDLYLVPVVTTSHIVFSLCRVKDDRMVHALKLPRHKKDTKFVLVIVKMLCLPS
jgi:hypothetical protein